MEQRYYWIIGASSGIGEALAYELAQQGHSVALSARRKDTLERVKQQCKNSNQHCAIPLDVTNIQTIQAAFSTLLSQWPQLDSVIFMAGDYTPLAINEIKEAQYQNLINTNLLGAFRTVETVLPYFLKQRFKGQIALCASVAGYRGLPKSQPYGASKAALINFAESLAVDVGDQVDIKLICPGFVKTRLTDKNQFVMPMRIKPDQAASSIAKGLKSQQFEIAMPWLFTKIMKVIQLLPWCIYRSIGRNMQPKDN